MVWRVILAVILVVIFTVLVSYLMFQDIVELESFFRITTDHPPNQILGLGRDKWRNVVDTFFHFFQQLTKIIVVKG